MMERLGCILLISLLGFASLIFIAVNGQSECQCAGFVVNDLEGYSEWFYTFPTFFGDTCDDLEGCNDFCYDLSYNYTNGGDLNYVPPNENQTIGELVCQEIAHDVSPGARIAFEYQLCVSAWNDTNLVTTPGFCCYAGVFPEGGC